jgi:putative ABC transport system ATP-binding protein
VTGARNRSSLEDIRIIRRSQLAQVTHPSIEPTIELRGVSRAYRTPQGEFHALAELDLRVSPRELVAVIGMSGSGKSTLVNLIAGIDRPTAGSVRVAGTDVGRLGESALAAWRGRTVGVVFQFFQLLPTLTILENVVLPIDFCGTLPAAKARARATQLLDRVGIADQADKLPSALSGGQQQRAAIARALANDPPVVIADEPTGNLDSRTAASVLELLASLARDGKTVILVTHERDLGRIADRVIALADGRLVDDARTPRQVARG